ncbi:FAD-dependent monooxygenase [Actinomadura rupiterrae]|uniref:FAD-dependent monooxygenase n=1 Tax=Actinomadura rupiterrae TaxID=559627 RepID=UPI0020A2C993|nr:FAD-dependent monooxygenase [Actinomadura rupiterrae]MCP2340923.1 2-polyprenyl-6-methoxyphenol hydroxylase-like FAD-dependent oxidoreductase [Actinomadura rupiterrae]
MTGEENVVIVGAGPTGLLLAGDLAAAGVDCTLLERRADVPNLTRAFAVHARTLETLHQRGVADELLATGRRVGRLRLPGGARLDLSGLPTRFPFVLVTPQYETEKVLEERALAAGAEIIRGAEVVALWQDGLSVEVRYRLDGREQSIRGAYVVGADGVHSTVREQIGMLFPGESAVRSVMLADVRLADPPDEVLTVGASGDAFGFIAPFGDGWYRVIGWNRARQLPDSAPVDVEELRGVLRRVFGTDHGMGEPRWTSRFHSDERQAPRYRMGRVFLAGDAAHVHSPVGGQGMNTGLQDAANLGWKLAAQLRGHAPSWLLDSYNEERHPVGRLVLRVSGTLLRGVLVERRAVRLGRSVLLRAVTRTPPAARRMAGFLSGIDIAYPAPRGAHRLIGKRAPDVRLGGGGRLHEALRDGRFVLVVAANDPAVTYLATRNWADRVRCVPAGGATRTTALVRPDGYVAWATDETAPERRAPEIREALEKWCGPPAEHGHAHGPADRHGARAHLHGNDQGRNP